MMDAALNTAIQARDRALDAVPKAHFASLVPKSLNSPRYFMLRKRSSAYSATSNQQPISQNHKFDIR